MSHHAPRPPLPVIDHIFHSRYKGTRGHKKGRNFSPISRSSTAAQEMNIAILSLLLEILAVHASGLECRTVSIGSYNDIHFTRAELLKVAGADADLTQACITQCNKALDKTCNTGGLGGKLAHAIEHYKSSPDCCGFDSTAGVCLYLNGVSFDDVQCGCPISLVLPPLLTETSHTAKNPNSQVSCGRIELQNRLNEFFKEDDLSVQKIGVDDTDDKFDCDRSAKQQCLDFSGVLFA